MKRIAGIKELLYLYKNEQKERQDCYNAPYPTLHKEKEGREIEGGKDG
jgi:hypothetical protein